MPKKQRNYFISLEEVGSLSWHENCSIGKCRAHLRVHCRAKVRDGKTLRNDPKTGSERSFIEIGEEKGGITYYYNLQPHKPARPMEIVRDKNGDYWLCDKGVDPQK